MARVYESCTNRALVHNYFIARKFCVLSRYVANNYNVFPANTYFNDAYQTISYIQFIATGRVAPVTGYKWLIKMYTVFALSLKSGTVAQRHSATKSDQIDGWSVQIPYFLDYSTPLFNSRPRIDRALCPGLRVILREIDSATQR